MNFNNKTVFFVAILLITFSPVLYIHLNKAKSLNWSNIIRITGAFIKNSVNEPKLKNVQNLPSKFEQFSKIFNFFTNANNSPSANYITEKISGLNIIFHSYQHFYPVYDDVFIKKFYYFETDSPQPFILDCGSNTGNATIFFKLLYPNAHILSFEPTSLNFRLLEKNIKNNNIKNVSLFQKALFNKKGKIKLYNVQSSLGSRIFDKNHPAQDYEIVDSVLLSEYINKPVDLIKMDIEGAETAVITDLDENKKLDFVQKIILEYHYYPGQNTYTSQNSLIKILQILEKNKFAYQIHNDTIKLPFKENKDEKYLLIFAYKEKA